jgi:putative membrane protein
MRLLTRPNLPDCGTGAAAPEHLTRGRSDRHPWAVIRWLLVSWALNAIALGITGWILSGVSFNGSGWTLIWAALVFGLLNTILKPILKLLTLPLAIVTLGIAWFFVSMLMLWLTDLIIGAFDIDGFWNYVWATIIVWAVNLVVDALLRRDDGRAGSLATA